MSTQLKELETRFTAMQAEAKKLGEEIERLKKEEAGGVRLKSPKEGERYWQRSSCGGVTNNYKASDSITNRGFASTNEKQARAFHDAIDVMAELRMQPGIAVPDGKNMFLTICYRIEGDWLMVDTFSSVYHNQITPAFKTEVDAKNAITAVGEERIKAAYKTLLFMTPESRGEV